MKSDLPSQPSASSSAPPPSYNDTISSPTSSRLPALPPSYVSSLRTTRIAAFVNDHIHPYVQQSVATGITSSTLILVPSDVWKLKNVDTSNSYVKLDPDFKFPGEKVLGFPDNEAITIQRLTGPDHKLEFWKQASVVRELSSTIQTMLRGEGYIVVDHAVEQRVQLTSRNGTTSPSLDVRPVEWKTMEQPPLGYGEARNKSEVKEVTLRMENEMGLYETRSGMAIVMKIEIGGARELEDF